MKLKATPFLLCIFTIAWYFTSSKNAVATQQFVQFYSKSMYDEEQVKSPGLSLHFGMMASLTFLQLVIGLVVAKVLLLSVNKFQALHSRDPINTPVGTRYGNKGYGIPFIIGSLHFLGSFATNMGFSFGTASIVQILKLLEPIETLLLAFIVHRCFKNLTKNNAGFVGGPMQIISILAIVFGAFMLLSSSDLQKHVNIYTVTFAALSGLALSSRNVIKKVFNCEESVCQLQLPGKGLENFISITQYALIPSFFCLILGEASCIKNHNADIRFYTSFIIEHGGNAGKHAILFHGLYNIFSITVLNLVSAPTHSLLNVGKRIFNVLMAALYCNEELGRKGVFGLIIAAIGSYGYAKKNATTHLYFLKAMMNAVKGTEKKKVSISVMSLLFVSLQLFTIHFQDFQNQIISGTVSTKTAPLPSRDRKVILFGPHDRYNFGDLLFTKVITRLLHTRKGYSFEDILFGGIISTNMTIYGGEENIQSMRSLQNISRSDKFKGPYDIVSFRCGMYMFRDKDEKKWP